MSDATRHFEAEIARLIRHFRCEYDLTYAEAIGCLHLAAHAIAKEAYEDDEEDEEE